MRASTSLMATLSTLLLIGCGKEPERPRAAIAIPDRAQFRKCLDFATVVPNLPPYESLALPDGRLVMLLDRVRERDTITARFVVQERNGRMICQASTRYADTWAGEVVKAVR